MNPLSRLRRVLPLGLALAGAVSLHAAETQTPAAAPKSDSPTPSGPQTDGAFRKVILDADRVVDGEWRDTLVDPMELAVAKDGRVLWAERAGVVKLWKPDTKETVVIAKIPVFDGLEDGLLGITLDPDFLKNGWVYLNHSQPETQTNAQGNKSGIIRTARYTLKGDQLDLASAVTILDVETQRDECCHVGGSLGFDAAGNLYVAIGDNTNPFDSDGFSPSDERPGRSAWDAQKSSANMNDLRGGISRVKPKPEGGYTIPPGNLFPPGTPGTRPEVYVKGTRNGYRLAVDQKTGILYWGDVGPDAGGLDPKRGPGGFDAVMQAKQPGFFGWPYSRGDNRPYAKVDFEARAKFTKEMEAYNAAVKAAKDKGEPVPADLKKPESYTAGEPVFYDPAKPVNTSPNNTGVKELPPTQPAFIWYPHSPSTRFPAVNGGGGRTAMAGPVYYYDETVKNPHKLPKEFDRCLFIYEWSRNWIVAVHLDENSNIAKGPDGKPKMERFCPNMTFKRPMDMELGADGCLYLIEWGSAWGNNKDTQIIRLEYTGATAAK